MSLPSSSYSGDPKSSLKDMVRFMIGDTDSDSFEFNNEEIQAILEDKSDDVQATALFCLDSLIGRYSRKYTSKTVGDLSISYGDRMKSLKDLRGQISKQQSLALAEPYAGGISIADKESVASNTDRVKPTFHRGMMRNRNEDVVEEVTE